MIMTQARPYGNRLAREPGGLRTEEGAGMFAVSDKVLITARAGDRLGGLTATVVEIVQTESGVELYEVRLEDQTRGTQYVMRDAELLRLEDLAERAVGSEEPVPA